MFDSIAHMADQEEGVGHRWAGVPELATPPGLSSERRLHVRAQSYWRSLLDGGTCPRIADLDLAALGEFGDGAVLFDIRNGDAGAVVQSIGAALEEETDSADPTRTLLGQMMDRLPALRVLRAPLGFEADRREASGRTTLYRGCLLPFADEANEICHVLGVVSWKTCAAIDVELDVQAAVQNARTASAPLAYGSPWDLPVAEMRLPAASRAERIAAARTRAALAGLDRLRPVASLHAALGAAYDLLIDAPAAGSPTQIDDARTIVNVVFGGDLRRGQAARYRAVLAHAARLGVAAGQLGARLDCHRGGAAAFAACEWRLRRAAAARQGAPTATCEPLTRLVLVPLAAPHPRRPIASDGQTLQDRRACA